MELDILNKAFTICKLPEDSPGKPRDGFFFLSRTDDELSLVCETSFVPERTLARDDGWRGFRIRGVLDFSLIGILADISGRLAREGISIFAVSTYNRIISSQKRMCSTEPSPYCGKQGTPFAEYQKKK
jgi:hypothetical protein